MDYSKNQKSISSDNKELLQTYYYSYKKHKYWLRLFYAFAFIVYLLLNNNKIIRDKIEKYHSSKQLVEDVSELKTFLHPEDLLSTKTINSILMKKFKYYPIKYQNGTTWDTMKNQLYKYREIIKLADTLNLKTESKFSIEIENYKNFIVLDTTYINDEILRFENILLSNLDLPDSIRKPLVRDTLKPNFIKHFNKDVIIDYRSYLPISDLSEYFFGKSINHEYVKFGDAENDYNFIKSILDESLVEIKNFKVPIAYKLIRNFALPILVILAINLNFLFINYIYYDELLDKNKKSLVKGLSLRNISIRMNIPKFSNKKFLDILALSTNIILPFIIILLLGKQISLILDSYLLFITFWIIYILIFSSIIVSISSNFSKYINKSNK